MYTRLLIDLKLLENGLQVFLGRTASPLLVHDISTCNHDLNSDCDEEKGHQAGSVAANNCNMELALFLTQNTWG